jgi:hypothetical protein
MSRIPVEVGTAGVVVVVVVDTTAEVAVDFEVDSVVAIITITETSHVLAEGAEVLITWCVIVPPGFVKRVGIEAMIRTVNIVRTFGVD